MATSSQQINATLQVIHAIGEAIQSLGSVPSGHLYARLMDKLNIDQYQTIIGVLVRAGLVKEDGSHMLTWVGPKEGK